MLINDFIQELSQKVGPLYLVTGTETQLISQIRHSFENLLTPTERDMNFVEFNLEETELTTVLAEAASLPFMGSYRLIFVTNTYFLSSNQSLGKPQAAFKELEKYLKHPQPTTVLVFFAPYEKLDQRKKITKLFLKHCQVVSAQKLTAQQLTIRLQQDVQEQHGQITKTALEQLILRTNSDYSLASNELQKLLLYQPGQPITEGTVQQLVPQTLDDNVFDLMTAILKGDLKQAESDYHQLLLLKSEVVGITALAQAQLRLLLQVKLLQQKGMAVGKLSGYLQVHPYRIKLAVQRSQQYSVAELKKALRDLITIDYRMKSGQGDKEQLFELFMIQFIQTKKSA